MLKSVHPVFEFRGSPRACGRSYGESQAEAIRAYLHMDIRSTPERRRYARRCWNVLEEWERPVVEFIRGMSRGSGLSVDEITMLLLHEDIGHLHQCTGIGATGPATRDGSAIIAQSWDAGPAKYPWASLVRLHTDSAPATLTYAYPGLWAAAGINEHGMSLVWTGAGYRPLVQPGVGVPTYALIPGILGCKTCQEAVALVQRTRNAGSFIFFLADALGEVWVLEGIPGRVEAVRCRDIITRANHYEYPAICRAVKQRLPRVSSKWNSQTRARRAAALAKQFRGRIDGKTIEAMYRDHQPATGLCICLHGSPGPFLSIDSFYAVPSKKEFRIARGCVCRHEFARHSI